MGQIQEQSKNVRTKKPYITRFRVKPNDGKVSKDWVMVVVFNLSAGGIFFYSRTNLEVGTILDLKIGFYHYYPTIICVGKVIRMTKHPATSINGYSVEFTEIDEQIRKMINKNLEITELHQKLK
jgi:c-di-GMP-binding flagellar brake protein YcgR